ncbi:hypothetical protein CRG98_019641 [Punica granatum]|uniref:Retrotransposon gag domain-containing protein n=1 Tax=Punica granatum TaxID=22663 RepID=A0A2I0JUJ0_PUNGR|nr:hypothetical protein CRG98_019641 [Punica granatum]
MRLPPKFKIPEFKTYEGTTDPRHHLRHYRGKMLQYWEYEEFVIHSFQDSLSGSALDWFMSLKAEDIPTWEDLSRNFGKRRQYGTSSAPTIFGESHDHTDHRSYLLSSASTAPTSSISPGPNFDPSVQDQSKHCEYHQGTPGHTLDNCWRLRDEIQRSIDSNRLTFNAVRPPNVQANPLPDHRPSSGPSINMISICVSERDEEAQENPLPFVINYTLEEPTVGFTRHEASPAPFVIDIPAREPYSDSKVPWAYKGSVSSAAKDKGKTPAVKVGAAPESSPFPSKKVTEEEAETFMKIVKASEFKVVDQMAKSPAHISLLALLLGSEPRREALLRVLTTAQVPKGTSPDRIEETVGSIFSNTISFSDDEPPSEGWSHLRALHIVSVCAVTEEILSGVHIRLAQENEELDNWTSVPCYSAVIADV